MPIIGNVVRHDERRTIHLEFISGDHDEPMVLVHREVLYDIYHHADRELHHEVGGYLIGFPAIDHRTGVKVTYIEKAIRAIYNSSQTHVTMHPISFNEVENIRQHNGTILVGWYHSHPNMGIFFSSIDRKNFKSNHPEEYQISIVVDPSKTPEKDIENDSAWIGFYGWNSNGEVIQLPKKNIHYVNSRPKIVTTAIPVAAPIAHPLTQVESAIAAVEHASNILKKNQNVIHAYFPIVVLAKEFKQRLLSIPPSRPREGFIFGEVNYVAGYKLIFVDSIRFYELSRIREYQRLIGKPWRRYSQHPNKNKYPELEPYPVGIYLNEPQPTLFLFMDWLFRRHLNYKAFMKYLGDDYLVITTKSIRERKTLSYNIWSSSIHNLEQIPPSHILVREVQK
jgi:proteasome lid subunit RPN8/RPN11